MKRRVLLVLFILSLASLVFTIVPVAANEDIYLGDGYWCTYQGDGLWFCFETGPSYWELRHWNSTVA